MWKVLIADDEPKIRRGLAASIARMRDDMKVVAEAGDGEAAMALVEKERPDLLLVDIRMPFVNGLELIERVSSIHRDCVIIVVTGHDEFEYAQRALQLRVFEYLLKPVARDALAAVLVRADEELQRMRRLSRYVERARELLERNMPLLRERLLRDWVNGRLSQTEIEEQRAFLGVEVGAPAGMSIIHLVERSLPRDPERDRRVAALTVRGIAEEAFSGLQPLSVFQDESDNLVVVSACSPQLEWVAALERVVQDAKRSEGLVVLSAQRPVDGPAALAETYEALTAEVSQRGSHRAFVQRAQDYIDAHYREPDVSLEELASAIQISPGYLSRLLRQETGFAFVEYITRVRIAKAVQLMNDPAVRIYEVAEAVGYESQHYFSRAFKKVFGCSPAGYRRGGA